MEDVTNDQLSAVKRINKCTNYYDILNVDRNASDITIKKSYKKLALLLHPDKNKAPGAIDAFKKLGTAAAVLTDRSKRIEYDLYGSKFNVENSSEEQQWFGENSNDLNNLFGNGFNMQFQADISPEDFFNVFFNNNLNNFSPFNQNSVFSTSTPRHTNYYRDSEDYNDDNQDEIPSNREQNRTIEERSLFRKLLDFVFIFVITWILNVLLKPPSRRRR